MQLQLISHDPALSSLAVQALNTGDHVYVHENTVAAKLL